MTLTVPPGSPPRGWGSADEDSGRGVSGQYPVSSRARWTTSGRSYKHPGLSTIAGRTGNCRSNGKAVPMQATAYTRTIRHPRRQRLNLRPLGEALPCAQSRGWSGSSTRNLVVSNCSKASAAPAASPDSPRHRARSRFAISVRR